MDKDVSQVSDVRQLARNKLLVQQYIDGSTEFITESLIDRQFELQVKNDLLDSYQRMKNLKSEQRKFIRTFQLSFPKGFLKKKLSDVAKDLCNPKTSKELFQKLSEASKKYSKLNVFQFYDEGDEVKSTKQYCAVSPMQLNSTKKGFVTPRVRTPQFQKVFNFGSAMPSKGLPNSGTIKYPRLAKPGEPVFSFSATGSPVIVEATPNVRMNVIPSSDSARVKVDDGSGNVIDVDLVFRNASVAQRNKIVTDFRCMARTCSAVSKKIHPHRVPVNKNQGGSSSVRKVPRVCFNN